MRTFLGSRHAWLFVLGGLGLAVATSVVGDRIVPVPGAYDDAGVPLAIPTATIAPLAFVVLASYGQRTQLGDEEANAWRLIAWWRAAYATALSGLFCVFLGTATFSQPAPYSLGVVMRNYFVLIIVAFAGVALIGAIYAWIAPVLVAFVFMSVLGHVDWNPLLNTSHTPGMLVSLALVAVAVCALSGIRTWRSG